MEKNLKIEIPKIISAFVLCSILQCIDIDANDIDGMADSVGPDQIASDLALRL